MYHLDAYVLYTRLFLKSLLVCLKQRQKKSVRLTALVTELTMVDDFRG